MEGIGLTVNWPVSLSISTCVTCMGLEGVDIVGLRGVLLRPFTRLENSPFFFPSGLASSEYLCRGLFAPLLSDRGGVTRSIMRPSCAKLCDCRRFLGDVEAGFEV